MLSGKVCFSDGGWAWTLIVANLRRTHQVNGSLSLYGMVGGIRCCIITCSHCRCRRHPSLPLSNFANICISGCHALAQDHISTGNGASFKSKLQRELAVTGIAGGISVGRQLSPTWTLRPFACNTRSTRAFDHPHLISRSIAWKSFFPFLTAVTSRCHNLSTSHHALQRSEGSGQATPCRGPRQRR